MTTPASISAINLSLIIVAIVVPLNVVFGVVTALALARGNFRGKRVIETVVDLPFAVSPVVVGVSLILLWGIDGWFGGLADHGIRIIFSLPGMVIATIFVTLPVRGPGGGAGAARDRRRAGAGGRHPGGVVAPDLLAHHAARRSAGASSTAWFSRWPARWGSSAP